VEEVILVDECDKALGLMEKNEAHKKGMLHRAFSIYIYNGKGDLLLQKRAKDKYHSGGLWTNTCCGHPRNGETVYNAASRRLLEEMGMKTALETSKTFIYKAKVGNEMTEHEYLHVFVGKTESEPLINLEEAEDWKFSDLKSVREEMSNTPEKFTEWFKITLPLITT
jgi:isopentenyl-diphosphate Delta-isomerase